MGRRVALFNMPFAPATRPSIQTGILKAVLEHHGILARAFYPNIDLYARMRRKGYHGQYTAQVPSQVYEWYFAQRPFQPGLAGPDWAACMRLEHYAKSTGFAWSSMLDIKQAMVPEFLDELMQPDYSEFDLFGFTMTYPQINASLALARRLKERHPDKPIVFGGAGSQIHAESAAELLRVFPFLDAGVVGEGEPVLVPLVERLLAGEPPEDLPDVYYRHQGQVKRSVGVQGAYSMDDPYFPLYDEYFDKLKELEPATRGLMERVLPIEMGRGCAWGDKRTCKFCAFTFHGTFRRRSTERVLQEVRRQVERYFPKGSPAFYVVDDLVTVPMIQEIFPELPHIHPRIRIPFMEVRTALTERHLDILKAAGVQLIQPGTESMDDGLLEKMSKGTTVFHNLMFLKGCRERSIRVSHNIILGFPDATTEDLQAQLRHLRLIPHLDPPYAIQLGFVRFSPYYHERERYRFRNWRADEFYRALYPDGTDIEKVAYEYQFDRQIPAEHQELYRRTAETLQAWQQAWSRATPPYLWFEGDAIRDGRWGPEKVHPLDGPLAAVVAAIMSKPLNPARIREVTGAGEEFVRASLAPLVEAGVVLEMRDRFLCLAVDRARVEGGGGDASTFREGALQG
ncbi:MAG: RiPP maturation radical SAM C-methyltransferase [Candidatus Eremiobacterota bacterium]